MGSGISDMVGDVKGIKSLFGDKNVMDPNEAQWGDLSGGEKTARVMGGLANGFTRGMQTMPQPRPQPGGGAPIQVPPTPQPTQQFDPNYLLNRQQPTMGPRNAMPYSNSEAFYGR